MTAGDHGLTGDAAGRWLNRALYAAVAVACIVQLIVFFDRRDLWQDEAMIALNIRYLSGSELLGKLEYDQVAPAGWLLLQKLFDGLTGQVEYDLRLSSLAAGVLAAVALPGMAAIVAGRSGALLAAVLFAVSAAAVRYATEAKPYMVDVLVAVVVSGLGLRLLSERRLRPLAVAILGVAGVVAILMSFPSVFILFGVGTVLAAHALASKDYRGALLLAAAGLVWLGLFGSLMASVSTPQAAGTTVTDGSSHGWFVTAAYLPLPPTSADDLRWIARWGERTLRFFFGQGKYVAAVLILGGIVVLARRRPWPLAILLLPLAAALVASGRYLYPLFDRTLLFMLPALLVLIGAAVAALAARGRGGRIAAVAVAALLVVPALLPLATQLGRPSPFGRQEVTPLMAVLAAERSPGDLIYVSQRATPGYVLYSREGRLAGVPWFAGRTRTADWTCWGAELPLTPRPVRVWLVHPHPTAPANGLRAIAGGFTLSTPVVRARTDTSRLYSFVARQTAAPSAAGRAALRKACATSSDDLSFPVPPRFRDAA